MICMATSGSGLAIGMRAYSAERVVNPRGPKTGEMKVLRGGSWGDSENRCRLAYRAGTNPNDHLDDLGFRIVSDKAP